MIAESTLAIRTLNILVFTSTSKGVAPCISGFLLGNFNHRVAKRSILVKGNRLATRKASIPRNLEMAITFVN